MVVSYSDRPWFCLLGRPKQEPIAIAELRNQGFPAFFPLRATGNGIEGLFPGYLFAQPLENGFWAPMKNTRGVAALLMSAPSSPSRVPPPAMDIIHAMVDGTGVMWPEPSRAITEGGRFKVVAGPFAGFAAACTRKTQDRVFGLLEILGRKQEVPFNRGEVEAA